MKKNESAVPMRITVDGEVPILRIMTTMRAAGIMEPMKALVMMPRLADTVEKAKPMTMEVTAPSMAPEAMPVV